MDASKIGVREGSPAAAHSSSVRLSPWVHERPPAWQELLSAHDVARLTRRPRWMVIGLTWLGQFPARRCFHGRRVGWVKGEVVEWLARDISAKRCSGVVGRPFQSVLPMHFPRTKHGKRRGVCATRKKGAAHGN